MHWPKMQMINQCFNLYLLHFGHKESKQAAGRNFPKTHKSHIMHICLKNVKQTKSNCSVMNFLWALIDDDHDDVFRY